MAIVKVMDQTRQNSAEQHTKNLAARQLVISRFSEFEARIHNAFERYESFRDACGDYEELIMCLKEIKKESSTSNKSTVDLLKSMKLDLEQEIFGYFKRGREGKGISIQK